MDPVSAGIIGGTTLLGGFLAGQGGSNQTGTQTVVQQPTYHPATNTAANQLIGMTQPPPASAMPQVTIPNPAYTMYGGENILGVPLSTQRDLSGAGMGLRIAQLRELAPTTMVPSMFVDNPVPVSWAIAEAQAEIDRLQGVDPGIPVGQAITSQVYSQTPGYGGTPVLDYWQQYPTDIQNPAFDVADTFVADLTPQEQTLQQEIINRATTPNPAQQAAQDYITGRLSGGGAGLPGIPPPVGGGGGGIPTPAANPAIAPALAKAQETPPQVAAASAALGNIAQGGSPIDTSALEGFLGTQTNTDVLTPFLPGPGMVTNPAADIYLDMYNNSLGGNEYTQQISDYVADQAIRNANSIFGASGQMPGSSAEYGNIANESVRMLAPFMFDQHQKDQQLRALGAQLYGATNAQDLARSLEAASTVVGVRSQDLLRELQARGAITEARAQDVSNELGAATALGGIGIDNLRAQIDALDVAGRAGAADTQAATQRAVAELQAAVNQYGQQLNYLSNQDRVNATLAGLGPSFQAQDIASLGAGMDAASLTRLIEQQELDLARMYADPYYNARAFGEAVNPLFGLPAGSTTQRPIYGPTTAQAFGGALMGAGQAMSPFLLANMMQPQAAAQPQWAALQPGFNWY